MKMIKFLYTPWFRKSFKLLEKKYSSLQEDLKYFCETLKNNPIGYPPSTIRISGLWENVYIPIYKTKKFAVECLHKVNSGIRIVYAYNPEQDCIEFIEFIEIYHKNTQENHNIELLKKIYIWKTDLPSWYATEESI